MLMSQVGISAVERALSPSIWHAFRRRWNAACKWAPKRNCESRTPAVNINNQVAALGESESMTVRLCIPYFGCTRKYYIAVCSLLQRV